jgi:hypothetical protein
MSQMIRKQVDLPKDLDDSIRVLSQSQKKPEAAVIRELLELGLDKKRPLSAGEALLGLARLGEKFGTSGPTDLSDRHDDYLYGDKE